MSDKQDNVALTHPLFDAGADSRQTWRDAIAGTEAFRLAGKRYLPQFPAEQDASWTTRLSIATFHNVTKKTLEAFCGLVFQKDLSFADDVPESIAQLAENIDNKGNHINVFARDLFEDSFAGYAAILVDSPTMQAGDLGEQRSLGLRPYWVKYSAENIINWDYQINAVSRKRELSMIVLKEMVTRRTGKFRRESVCQYRVLMLNGSSVAWELYEEVKDAHGKVSDYIIVGYGTIAKQTAIPVAVVGELGDEPPLMDLAYKNIEHYQDYSDYRSLKHKTAVPLLFTVNLDGEPEAVGGDVWFKCNDGGSVGWAVADPAALDAHEKGLENVKREMGQLGLAMLAGTGVKGDTTATETMLDSIQETSALQVKATQLKDALELALGFTAKYLGEKDGGSIELGANWNQMVMSAQELASLASLFEQGLISKESIVWTLYKAGKLPPDVEVEDELKRIEDDEAAMASTRPVIDAGGFGNANNQTQEANGETAAA